MGLLRRRPGVRKRNIMIESELRSTKLFVFLLPSHTAHWFSFACLLFFLRLIHASPSCLFDNVRSCMLYLYLLFYADLDHFYFFEKIHTNT